MEGEERNKVGSKRRAKRIEVGFDSGDDEPIGSFLKLKSKRNIKKNKLGLGGSGDKGSKGVERLVVEDEDLVGMDDTLASFRKKLRAPKKDPGHVAMVGKDSGGNLVVPSDQSLNDLAEDRGLATKVAEKVLVDGDDGYHRSVDKGLEVAARRKIRKSGVALALKNIGTDFEPDDMRRDHQRSGEDSSEHEEDVALGSGEDSLKCSDDGLEDSLSAFFCKAQSGFIRKSRSSLRLKLGKETQASSDGSDQISNDASEDFLLESTRKPQSALKLPNELAESNEDVHQASGRGMVDSIVMRDKPDSTLQGKFSTTNSRPELSFAPLVTDETLKSREIFADASTIEIPENSVHIDTHQNSLFSLRICSNSLMIVQDARLTCQTSSSEPSENPKMEATNILSHVEMPVSVSASEDFDDCHLDEDASLRVSNNDLNLQSISISTNHAPDAGQKTCNSVGMEVLQFCQGYGSPNRECEDKPPCSYWQASGEIMGPSTSPIEDSTTSKEKIGIAENSLDGLDSERPVQDSRQAEMVQSLSAPDAMDKELSPNHCNFPDKVADNCLEETVIASISSRNEYAQALKDSSSPISACKISKYGTVVQVKDQDKSLRHCDDSNHFFESPTPNDSTIIHKCSSASNQNKPFDCVSKDACHSGYDCFSGDEEAKGATSPSDVPDSNESYAGAIGVLPDCENKTNRLSAVQRRKAKRRRHGDMSYEGDADWEVLIQEQEFLVGHQVGDDDQPSKSREKLSSSLSTISNAENGGAAAISAGLKARAVVPVEKIRFKEVLKRKGALQEYLECRNFILSLWHKDVSRILPLSDCVGSDTALVDESPRASLVRDIYAFLDQCGYINFGVASEKAENGGAHSLKLLKEENFVEKSGAPVADANDGVSFILGRFRNSENSSLEKPEIVVDGGKELARGKLDERFVELQADNNNTRTEPDGLNADNNEENGAPDAKVSDQVARLDDLGSNPSSEDENCRMPVTNPGVIAIYSADHGSTVPVVLSEDPKGSSNLQSTTVDDRSHPMICDFDARKRIIVVGAGPAGLTAARHLQRQGFNVTVLEGRSRIGGRVYTDRSSLSVPVDLGASIITGVEADVATERRADPSSLVCAQLGLELTVLNSDCPLYDTVTGQKVPADLDEALEAEYNSLLDDMLLLVTQKGEHAMRMSLEDGLEHALKIRRTAHCGRNLVHNEDVSVDEDVPREQSCKGEILSPLERRVMDWHFANLEYGCAALLKEVSLPYWNQDDEYGGFGGAHCMIKGGYSAVVESLGEGLNIHLNHVVTEVLYCVKDGTGNDDQCKKVKVSVSNGREFSGDAVLITVPLGCLKAETIKFSPALPQWKSLSIQRLGFGVLNKVVMEFAEVFWDDSIDYFGATAEETNQRGWCFMFWNVKKTVGAPVLIALVVGKAAIDGQNMSSSDHVNHALVILRKLFGETSVPDPVASVVTDWGRDPYSYGAYSYVAVGSSGEDYDLLGRPVENCLFFAGEATCKEHPDTVGGAMLSGLREAVRIIDILSTGTDYTAEVEVMEAAKRHLDVERSEIRDIIKTLDAIELSNVLCKNPLDQTQILTRESLLKDMFYNAKTTAGRLHVVKELLKLPVRILKSFAGTKEGLSMLNSWMLDSMGTDGTQLLRHCVRLLVLVSTDLLAVRLSGIGKTVKEKVCVHTSRDIRTIASQLVSVWIEIFRKEKASNGGLKLLRQPIAVDSSKNKCGQASGRPPLHINHIAADNKGSIKVSSSKNHLHSDSNMKKLNTAKPAKFETRPDSKSEVKSSNFQGSVGRQNAFGEESKEFAMTEEEKAAFAAAEAARAAALAAAEAYASSGTKSSTSLQLPKIPSFHKFARREQYARMDESNVKKNWSGGAYGKQDCLSEIDSRNCRVRDWSVDFSAAGVNIDTSKMSVDNRSQQSQSNEITCQLNFREHSGESVAVDSSLFTKAWVDSAGSEGIKDYNAIERWQCQAAAANSDIFHQAMHLTDEEDSNMSSKLPTWKDDARANESSASKVTVNKEFVGNQPRGAEHIKQAVVDYVASLLMPLYKARKIDKEGYKSIMKKTATKVMEQTNDAEKAMAVFEFLDFKRKNKIRAFVDTLIERHMAMKAAAKS